MFFPIGKNMGVYQIFNTINSKKYVGSTCDLRRRKRQHVHKLRKGDHGNPRVQSDFDEFGANVFAFLVLELVDNRKDLLKVEQEWIDKLNPEYNVSPRAKSGGGDYTLGKHSQKKRSKTVKQLWAEGHYDHLKGAKRVFKAGHGPNLGKKFSAETREKIRQATLGKNNPNYGKPRSKETKDKISKANKKTYSGAIAPDGTIYAPIVGMTDFCKEHELEVSCMVAVMKGRRNSHKGWIKYNGYNRKCSYNNS